MATSRSDLGDEGLVHAPLEGVGTITYDVTALSLLGGTYGLAVALQGRFAQRPQARVEYASAFKVVDEAGRSGLVELGGRWSTS